MKIHLKLNGQVIPATLADNRTAQEFVAMLPLTLTMHDLFRREKFGPLPAPISGTGTRTQAYEVGDMVCWAPGPDLSIFYRQDGQPISGGFHVLGRIDAGIDVFAAAGPFEVTIEVPASEIDQSVPGVAALAIGACGLRGRGGASVIGGRCS